MARDKDYWKQRWQEGETGWKAHSAEEDLFSRFSLLKTFFPQGDIKVFVPLCGDTSAIKFFYDQGFTVHALDFAPEALDILQKNDFPELVFQKSENAYAKAGRLELYCEDFFTFQSEVKFDFIYDRAAFLAIDPEQRDPYVRRLSSLLTEEGLIFLDVFAFDFGEDYEGPPFSISPEDVALYFSGFEVLDQEIFKQESNGRELLRQIQLLKMRVC